MANLTVSAVLAQVDALLPNGYTTEEKCRWVTQAEGFIRAEVIAFEDMKTCGTMANAKAKGLVRSEGKEYVMKDGDIVNFLFNV